MRKLTKLDLQALAETMPVIPVDEQRFYLAMGSYGPEPSGTYLSQEDMDNFMSGLDRTTAYSNDCMFATIALATPDGTNDQAEINQLAEEWVMSNRQQELQNMYPGMNSDEAAQKYLKEKGAALTSDEVTDCYNQYIKRSGSTMMLKKPISGGVDHAMLVAGYNSETGTFSLFDGSESAYLNSGSSRIVTLTIDEMIQQGIDFEIWNGVERWGTINGTVGSWAPNGTFTPYGNDSGSGSSSSDEAGSSDGGSSGSSGDNPWYPGYSSGY